jgi:nitronate monooxygenase
MPANVNEEAPAWCSTRVTQRLGITYPIIQGPFAGVPTQRLTALVSNLGGLGSIGAHGLDDSAIHEAIDQVRSETDKPFAVNLFVSTSDTAGAKVGSEEIAPKISLLAPYYAELGVTPPAALQPKIQDFERQVRAAIDSRAPVLSFIYGIPPTEVMEECRRRAIPILGTATTADEARALEQAGFDLIVASGFEAGGHRGSFLRAAADSLTGSLSLIPQVADAVSIPVIAAGGIADGRGIAAAFCLGAEAALLGTAFLACAESGASEAYRAALLDRPAHNTGLTTALTGRLARAIKNRLMSETAASIDSPLPYPVQYTLIRTVVEPALLQQRWDLVPLWAGQSAGMLHWTGTAELMTALISEADACLQKIADARSGQQARGSGRR